MLLFALRDSSSDTTARAVSEHKEHLDAKVFDSIVNTTHDHLTVNIVTSCADDKDVADALIEEQLHRYT